MDPRVSVQDRARRGKRVGLAATGANLVLFAAKLAGGLLSGSISLCADAVNNLSDALGGVVTAVGFKVASKPADEKHPYGHARSEYVATLILAVFMAVASIELGKSSVERILAPVALDLSLPLFLLTAAAVVVKLVLGAFYKKRAKEIDSRTLSAAATDSFLDALATFSILAGMLTERFFALRADAYLGLFVCLLLLISGVRILIDTLDPLLGAPPEPAQIRAYEARILRHPEVSGVHDLIIHNYGVHRDFATAHIEVDADPDLERAHALADGIEREFLRDEGVTLTIHIDPVRRDDPLAIEAQNALAGFLSELSEELSAHDFRVVRTGNETSFFFDLKVPSGFSVPDAELRKHVSAFLETRFPETRVDLTIDRGFLPSI